MSEWRQSYVTQQCQIQNCPKELEWGKPSALKGSELTGFEIRRTTNAIGPLLLHTAKGRLTAEHSELTGRWWL